MKLFRLCVSQLHVGHELPWNVYNEQGQLLLHKGYTLKDHEQLTSLVERGMYVDQDDFDRHIEAQQRDVRRKAPDQLWGWVHTRMSALLNDPLSSPNWQADVQEVASDVQHATEVSREPHLFESLFKDNPDDYAVSHAIQTAYIVNLMSERMGWNPAARLTLTHAALSMNLSMTGLQKQLSTQLTAPTGQQRQAIHDHGARSRDMLEQLGVTDPDWLQAVAQHHVTPNGGPLSTAKAGASDLACALHYADVYLAKISARSTRAAMPSNQAARTLFLQADGQHNPYVSALIKELGIYPPGTCVRLANGESGIVVQRGEAAHLPKVCALVDAKGSPFPYPLARDTSQVSYKVIDAMPRGSLRRRMPSSAALHRALVA